MRPFGPLTGAGSGTGILLLPVPDPYAAELIRRAARVTGFEQSHRMVEICRDRHADRAAAFDPEDYERLAREPSGFMAFRLVPRPA